MKRIIAFSVLTICLLCACALPQDASPSPSNTDFSAKVITSFTFFNYTLGYSVYYSVSLDGLTAHMEKSDYTSEEISSDTVWSGEKWESFTAEVLDCNVQNWSGDYDGHMTDGDVWEVTVSGGFGTISVRGNSVYPSSYDKLLTVVDKYFNIEEPAPGAPAIELIAEAPLPAPDDGDWYEWDKAGNYPANIDFNCSLYYIEKEDLLVRTEIEDEETWRLIISRLDGSDAAILDTVTDSTVNYYDGFIYYSKDDSIWRVASDGSQKQRVIENKDLYFIYGGRIYTEFLESCGMEGGDRKEYDIPDVFIGPYSFENGYFYYGAVEQDEEGGDCWSIYRFDINTGKYNELMRNATGSFTVSNGNIYYVEDTLMRTDGITTEQIENCYVYNFNMYRNYILSIDDADSISAFNVSTGEEYPLFDLPLFCDDVFVMENSVFLYSGTSGDPVFRITFEDNKAKLWRLNGIGS